jgi:hypothetical protein
MVWSRICKELQLNYTNFLNFTIQNDVLDGTFSQANVEPERFGFWDDVILFHEIIVSMIMIFY